MREEGLPGLVPVELAVPGLSPGSLFHSHILEIHVGCQQSFEKYWRNLCMLLSSVFSQLNHRTCFWFVLNSSYFYPLFRKHLLREYIVSSF